jgi:hypothetical protein
MRDDDMTCKKCKHGNLFRVNREGFLENRVYNRWGYYPWLCASCKRRSIVKARGERRKKQAEFEPVSIPEKISQSYPSLGVKS